MESKEGYAILIDTDYFLFVVNVNKQKNLNLYEESRPFQTILQNLTVPTLVKYQCDLLRTF